VAVPALDLYDYILIARKIIRKYAGANRNACMDEDLEGDVARAVMVADTTFNIEYGRTLESWRCIRAIGYIRRYFEQRKQAKVANRPKYALTVDMNGVEGHILHWKEIERPHQRMEKEEEHQDRVQFLSEILRESQLTKRQIRHIQRYYVDEKTLQEIADEFETSCQNIQQSLANSLEKVRKVL